MATVSYGIMGGTLPGYGSGGTGWTWVPSGQTPRDNDPPDGEGPPSPGPPRGGNVPAPRVDPGGPHTAPGPIRAPNVTRAGAGPTAGLAPPHPRG